MLKIQLDGGREREKSTNDTSQAKYEKVHTNVSLLSKFRSELIENDILAYKAGDRLDISNIKTGDFVEIQGELQKNPLIDVLERFTDVFCIADIFSDKPELSNKKAASLKKHNENILLKQIKLFLEELKHTGTIDFILEGDNSTLVLSAQEQYLANDNISEILGGKFKILGKILKYAKMKMKVLTY